MNKIVVAVFDSAMGMYMTPMFAPSWGGILRSFSDEVNRSAQDNQLNKHPEDYELRCLGWFDEVTGVFSQSEGDHLLRARGKDVVIK